MLLAKPLEDLGDIKGTMYDFECVGDVLGMHVHDEETVHITIVARGKVKIHSHDWGIEAVAGQILNFRPYEPHEFTALESGTRIFNIVKKHGGAVNDYIPPIETKTESPVFSITAI